MFRLVSPWELWLETVLVCEWASWMVSGWGCGSEYVLLGALLELWKSVDLLVPSLLGDDLSATLSLVDLLSALVLDKSSVAPLVDSMETTMLGS